MNGETDSRDSGNHSFGGAWTEKKLQILRQYLEAYMLVMKYQRFNLVYIDAFAGTGSRSETTGSPNPAPSLFPEEEQEQRQRFYAGSAAIALQLTQCFDQYWFLEQDPKRYRDLGALRERFPSLASRMGFREGDANAVLPDVLAAHDWSKTRGVIFLDPYGANLDFDTIRKVAEVRALDVWILFPLGQAVNRMLTRDLSKMPTAWATRLDRVFGSARWRERFYPEETGQDLLFPLLGTKAKSCDWAAIVDFYKERLKSVFAEVAVETKLLRNSTNVPLFAFLFAMANPSPKAQRAALRIANHILKAE